MESIYWVSILIMLLPFFTFLPNCHHKISMYLVLLEMVSVLRSRPEFAVVTSKMVTRMRVQPFSRGNETLNTYICGYRLKLKLGGS